MTTRKPSRSFRPSLSALEARRLMTGPGDPGFIGPVAPPVTAAFDATLNASIETDAAGDRYVKVDGSDYEDQVIVLAYLPDAYSPSIKLQLSQYDGGRLISSRTTSFQIGTGRKFRQGYFGAVEIDAKGGDDTVLNQTAAPMSAFGGAGRNYLAGGAGYDYLTGGNEADSLYDAGGGSYMYGGGGADNLVGGPGDDTLVGWDGDDILNGGRGNDILYGNGGNDTLTGDWGDGAGEAGNDLLDGGNDNDTLRGHAGDDTLLGGLGDDFLDGWSGNDLLNGGEDDDTIYGGGGFDKLYGWGGDDWMDGGAEDDLLEGGEGNDLMYGREGNDRLFGQGGKDELHGGLDDDYLDAGYHVGGNFTYAESLYGGYGRDTFVAHYSFLFGDDDPDIFHDYYYYSGDTIVQVRHW